MKYVTALVIISTLIGKSVARCPLPDPPENGQIIYSTGSDVNGSFVDDSGIVRFQCKKGYNLVGVEVNFCNRGNWSFEHAVCSRTKCRPLPKVQYGKWTSTSGREKSKTTLICDVGYETSTKSSILICKRDNLELVWNGEMPHCIERVTCPDPGTSVNGSRVGPCCYAGDVVYYECDQGFRLVGDDEIVCRRDGTWTSRRPRCKPPKTCPNPPQIEFGRIENAVQSSDYFQPWDEAFVRCDSGYKAVNGSDYQFCSDDLIWEEDFAVCGEILCPRPNVPKNGHIEDNEDFLNATTFSFGFELNFRCNPGHRLVGNSWISCTEDGWSHQTPSCKEITCGNPGIPENGNIIGNYFQVGATVKFTCFSGFKLIGDSVRKCLTNGVWSGNQAICDTGRSHCPNPGVPANGRKIGKRYEIGDVVRFSCRRDYSLIGQKTLVCQEDGFWNGTVPQCEGVMEFERPEDVSFRVLLALDQKMVLQDSKKSQFQSSDEHASERVLNVNVAHNLVLYFVLDSSKSVGERNFNISLEFVKALVRRTGVSPSGTRVGVITYGSNVNTIFNPLEYTDTSSVLKALEKIKYTKGGTATSKALEEIRQSTFPLVKGNLRKAKSVIFLITDGKFNMGGNPEVTATALKNIGFDIYCIGITGNPNMASLKRVASSENEHVFKLHGFDTLQWVVDELLNGSVDYSRCGLSDREIQENHNVGRILGGTKVVKQWPWIAALYLKYPEISFHKLLCGGSLIDRQWILTAAHCVIPRTTNQTIKNSDVIIKLGITDINKITYVQEFEPILIVPHSKFHRAANYLKYDIALIKLSRPVKYTEHIRPICLPPKFAELPGDTVLYRANQSGTTMGWGYDGQLQFRESAPRGVTVLKEVSVAIQSKKTCESSLKDIDFNGEMFCAGDATGKNDTCHGDSGGPLMQPLGPENSGERYWVQVGIVSWGRGCGQRGLYGVYTNIAKLIEWIITNMKTH